MSLSEKEEVEMEESITLSPEIEESEQEPISFFCPSPNRTRNLFSPTPRWTHPITSFLILLLLPSLVIFYNSPTLAFTTDPTPIFVLVCLVIFIPSLALTTGDIMVELGVGSVVKAKVGEL